MVFWSKNHFPVDGRLAVITGGSKGMGKAVAVLLAKKGANVAIVARTQSALDSAVDELKAAAVRPDAQRFLAVSADLTTAPENERAFKEIKEWGGVPDIVWANAGGAAPGYFKDQDPQTLDQGIRYNYFTAMYTAHVALNMMTASPLPADAPRRHIVFTSSVVAFYSVAGYAEYAPSKAAIRGLADTLRQECLIYDIDVHCVCPATIFTPGFENEQLTKPDVTRKLEESDGGQTAEEVAEISVKKLEKGQYLVVTSFLGEAMRAAAWGGVPRGNIVWDTMFSWIIALVWVLGMGWSLDRQVKAFKPKENAKSK